MKSSKYFATLAVVLVVGMAAGCAHHTLDGVKVVKTAKPDLTAVWDARRAQCVDVSDRIGIDRQLNPSWIDPNTKQAAENRMQNQFAYFQGGGGLMPGWLTGPGDPRCGAFGTCQGRYLYTPTGVEPGWNPKLYVLNDGAAAELSISSLSTSVDGTPYPPTGPCFVGKIQKTFDDMIPTGAGGPDYSKNLGGTPKKFGGD